MSAIGTWVRLFGRFEAVAFVAQDKLIITLDGPSGSGKSTISPRLAAHYSIPCLDTGAMYRTVALRALAQGINLEDDEAVSLVARRLDFRFKMLGGVNAGEYSESKAPFVQMGKEIRTPEVSMAASRIAKLKGVRQILVAAQQKIGAEFGAVVEGRDAGTVIFPGARFKFYMTATDQERARRRFKELQEKLGDAAPGYDDVLSEMIKRDAQDSQRAESPMKPAEDAEIVDTTGLELDQVLQVLIDKVNQRRGVA